MIQITIKKNHWLSLMRIAVILSHPIPIEVSLAKRSFNKFYIMTLLSFFIFNYDFKTSINPWLFSTYLYHIPSQPTIMNSSELSLSMTWMSGLHVIICYSYEREVFFLYPKSPNDRERLSPPFTLPIWMYPPAFLILASYSSFYGLWSNDNSIALPALQRTLLESPALAI